MVRAKQAQGRRPKFPLGRYIPKWGVGKVLLAGASGFGDVAKRPNLFHDSPAPLPTSSHLFNFSRFLESLLTCSHLLSPLSSQLFSHPFSSPLSFFEIPASQLISNLVSPFPVSPQLFSAFCTRSQLFLPHLNSFLIPSRLVSALLNFSCLISILFSPHLVSAFFNISHAISTFPTSFQLFSPFLSPFSRLSILARALDFSHLIAPLLTSALLTFPQLFWPLNSPGCSEFLSARGQS